MLNLSIIDDAVNQCTEMSVDTPEINAARDLLPMHLPRMRPQIEGFRAALNLREYGADGLERQQGELRERIPPIHDAVRNKFKGISRRWSFAIRSSLMTKLKRKLKD